MFKPLVMINGWNMFVINFICLSDNSYMYTLCETLAEEGVMVIVRGSMRWSKGGGVGGSEKFKIKNLLILHGKKILDPRMGSLRYLRLFTMNLWNCLGSLLGIRRVIYENEFYVHFLVFPSRMRCILKDAFFSVKIFPHGIAFNF